MESPSKNSITDEPISRKVKLHDKEILCEIDCGSAVSVLPAAIYQQLFGSDNRRDQLQPCNEVFNFYTGMKISPIGCLALPVSFQGSTKQVVFFCYQNKRETITPFGPRFYEIV